MIAALVIFLREGIEASMIVAILLAYLNRIGRRDLFRDVLLGAGVALALAATAGVTIYFTIHRYADTRGQTIFETATYLLAATVLTYMTFWFRSHSRTISSELRGRVDHLVTGRQRWGLALLAGQAVGREGLETVVFTLAIAFATSRAQLLVGALIGLAGALTFAVLVYRLGHRINLARFFAVAGSLLMLFAAGLLVDAVENLQQLGWLPVLRQTLWSSGHVLTEGSTLGDLLHTFFGYSQSPTVLQLLTYVCYVGVALAFFLRRPRRRVQQPATT